MTAIFEELRRRVLEAERDPAIDTGQAAMAVVGEWLAENEPTIASRKLAAPTEFNGTLMQWFHWYSEGDGGHWRRLAAEAPGLAAAGITAVWLPPASKGGSVYDVGYGTYDLFDLGEFDQKGTVRTKYGTKEEYQQALAACREHGIQVYADVVFNHKLFGDEQEEFLATPYDPQTAPAGSAMNAPSAPGPTTALMDAAGRHSTMQWHWYHFDAVDYNGFERDFRAVWRVKGAAASTTWPSKRATTTS